LADLQVSLAVWQRFLAAQAIGRELDGTVVKVVPFGAFVELAAGGGVHGLLHSSECEPPEVGTRVRVRIKAIDNALRRMSLGVA
jgi:ribosomal protein S1